MYSALHNHSHYSLLDGYATPKEYLEQAKKDGCKALGFSDHCPLPIDNIDNWPEIRMTKEESYGYVEKIRELSEKYDFPVLAGFECEWSTRYKSWYKDFLLDELKVDYLAFGPHWVEHEGNFVYAPQFGDKKLLHIFVVNYKPKQFLLDYNFLSDDFLLLIYNLLVYILNSYIYLVRYHT